MNRERDDERFDRPDHRGRGPKNYKRTDERIHEDVCDSLLDDADVDASDIECTVCGGEVTLNGFVRTRAEKRRAEELAERVRGVGEIMNGLRVRAFESKDDSVGAPGTAHAAPGVVGAALAAKGAANVGLGASPQIGI